MLKLVIPGEEGRPGHRTKKWQSSGASEEKEPSGATEDGCGARFQPQVTTTTATTTRTRTTTTSPGKPTRPVLGFVLKAGVSNYFA